MSLVLYFSFTGCILIILFISMSVGSESFSYGNLHNSPTVNLSEVPYVFDHDAMLRKREEAMDLYDYCPEVGKVEKRSNLSVGEFWDLYDAKWWVTF